MFANNAPPTSVIVASLFSVSEPNRAAPRAFQSKLNEMAFQTVSIFHSGEKPMLTSDDKC